MFEGLRQKTYEQRFPVSKVHREATALILEENDIPAELQSQIKNLYSTDFSNLQSRPHFSTPSNESVNPLIPAKYQKTPKPTFPTNGQQLQPQRPIENPELPEPPTMLQEINNDVSSAINSFLGFSLVRKDFSSFRLAPNTKK